MSRPIPRSRSGHSFRVAGLMGDIDIGGLKRFGPQSSGNLRLVQNVFAFANDLVLYHAARISSKLVG